MFIPPQQPHAPGALLLYVFGPQCFNGNMKHSGVSCFPKNGRQFLSETLENCFVAYKCVHCQPK